MIPHMSNLDTTNWKQVPDNSDLPKIIEEELDFEPFNFEVKEVLGIPVYIKNIEQAPCIHMRFGFRYGAMHDEPGREGIAHFLEHMLFDGSSMFEDEKETEEFGKALTLDSLNAHTSISELFITGKCLAHNLKLVCDGIFSMILEPKLTEKSYEHEKKVITQEAWGVFLNQKRIDYIKKDLANTLTDMPDRIRIASALGWPDTIEKITYQDIKDAHKKYFVNENMEIYIAGNLDSIGGVEGCLKFLEEYLAKVPHGEVARPAFIPKNISNPKELIFDNTYTDIGLTDRQQASISLSVNIPRTENELQNRAPIDLAEQLLANLVYRKLRLENSWCYGAGASARINTDYKHFSIGGTINFEFVDEAINIIWKIIDDIKDGQYKEYFERAKRTWIESVIAREITTGNIIEAVGNRIRIYNQIDPLKDRLLRTANTDFEKVQKVIADYFTKDKVFVEIVRPGSEQGL